MPIDRDIPLPIQREVRQRCGFGCVLCGFPLYEYDHILGWANVQRHVAEEIVLLCDRHHRERTSGLLPQEAVRTANAAPHNLRSGVSAPYDLHYSGNQCQAALGGNLFTTTDNGYGTQMAPIVVDGVALIGFILADGHLLLNLLLHDESNRLVLRIRNNELLYSIDPWDIELVGRRLVIRLASRNILVDIRFEPPSRIEITRGRFLYNGVEILLDAEFLLLTNTSMMLSGCSMSNVGAGFVIGPQDVGTGCLMRLPNVSRYLGDRSRATKWAESAIAEARAFRNEA